MGTKRILFISHSSEFYGAEKYLHDLLRHIDSNKFKVYLICPRPGYLIEEASKIGLKNFVISYERWLLPQRFAWRMLYHVPINIIAVFKIAWLLYKLKIECVYTNTSVVLSGALASKMCNIPHIWHVHETIATGQEQFQHFLGLRFVFGLIDSLSTRIVVNSNKIKNIFPPRMQKKICVVYNGFNTKPFNAATYNKKALSFAINHERAVAVVGNLCERKGQKAAILAMPLIMKRYPSLKLLLVGKDTAPDQIYLRNLQALVKQYELGKNVLFIGYQEKMNEVYAKVDVLLVPSSDEPFGRVIVEAMLAGVPVIANAVGGIPEIIEHGKNGILLESREPHVIANAVVDLLGSEEKRESLSSVARVMAEERFDITRMIKKIEEIILDVGNEVYLKR